MNRAKELYEECTSKLEEDLGREPTLKEIENEWEELLENIRGCHETNI